MLDRGTIGDYHLLLAHDVVQKPESYQRVFQKPRMMSARIIMDNSICELGTAVSVDVVLEAVKILPHVECVVLPDVYLKQQETIEQCKDALVSWTEVFKRKVSHWEPRYMMVPQGTSIGWFTYCAQQFARDGRINYWGVPRNIVEYHGSRARAIQAVQMINPHRYTHLLGFSHDVLDDMTCARMPYVTGIDSAVPIRMAHHNIDIGENMHADLPPRKETNWWEDGSYDELARRNHHTVKNWLSQQ
jgi:hypothetical protein